MSNTHIVITTAGTSGDVIPFIALSRELIARGHEVTLMTSADHEPLSHAHGVRFLPTGEADRPQIGRDERAYFREQLLPAYHQSERQIGALVAQGKRVFGIVRVGHLGGMFSCERHGLPFVTVVPQPASVWNKGYPICDEDRLLINSWRCELGLPPLIGSRISEPSEASICLFPDWFGDADPELHSNHVFVGFPFLDREAATLPRDLEAFVVRHGPPIVFTAGTGVQDIGKFFEVARRLQAETGRSVLFLSQFHHTVPEASSPLFRIQAYADHAVLFPRAAMVVHNGGIGTVAQATRAALPQVVVPLVWDQPDNAARLEALGIGQRVELAELCPERLAAFLEQFEAMDRARLTLAAELVKACDAPALAADQVERSMRDTGRPALTDRLRGSARRGGEAIAGDL